MLSVLLHSVHVALLVGATLAVLVLLLPSRRPRRPAEREVERRVERLRRAASHGELVALAERRARQDLRETRPALPRHRPALLVFVAATLTAAIVHGGVCPEHFAEGLRFGLFFVVVTALQAGFAVAAARGHVAAVALPSVLVNGGCVALWLVTRTVGLPFGLAEVEPVGLWDVVAGAAEVTAVVAALRLRPRGAFALVTASPRTTVGV